MNQRQRQTYWEKTERLKRQFDAKYMDAIYQSIIKQFKRFGRDLDTIGKDAAISRLGLDLWERELIATFEKMYKDIAITFGNSVYRALKIESNQKGETFGFNAEWTKQVLDFLMAKGFVLVADITDTTKKKMEAIVQQGIEQGFGVDKIARLFLQDDDLKGFLTIKDIQGYAMMRAKRIVRTEVNRASNFGAMQGASAHPFYVDKIWISARDSRTRRIPADEFDHVEMDNQVKPFDEPFTSTGKKGEPVVAMQPGDLSAPAGFTINCRCSVGFIPLRDANGRLRMKPRLNQAQIN